MPIPAMRVLVSCMGLRIAMGALVQAAGLPNAMATAVIPAAAPLVDVGHQAARKATSGLRLAHRGLIRALHLGIIGMDVRARAC